MTGATVGKVSVSQYDKLLLNQRNGIIRTKPNLLQNYLNILLKEKNFFNFIQKNAGGGAQGNISPKQILSYKISLPPLAEQKQIVADIESEQSAVEQCKALLSKMEQKIADKLSEVWGN